MLSQKNYLNQVTLIESQCEPRKKAVNIPATVFNRSPLRERENKISIANMNNQNSNNMSTTNNSNNTPGRLGKTSLSPLRSRKCDTSISVKSKKKAEFQCTNHQNKIARYLVESQEESLFYCEKCAILLASQGFKVSKINEPTETNPHRKRQIEEFLTELESITVSLIKNNRVLHTNITQGESVYQSQLQKIHHYYSQFYQIIDQHKRRVLEEIKSQYEHSKHQVEKIKSVFDEAINQSDSMKEDINASMNSIIMQAEEAQYRPVMDLYIEKVRKFRSIVCQQIDDVSVKVRTVCFKDGEELCQLIAQGLGIEWQQQKGQMGESIASRQVNPVECLESEQKFAKSSLKELGGLFCSFDQ